MTILNNSEKYKWVNQHSQFLVTKILNELVFPRWNMLGYAVFYTSVWKYTIANSITKYMRKSKLNFLLRCILNFKTQWRWHRLVPHVRSWKTLEWIIWLINNWLCVPIKMNFIMTDSIWIYSESTEIWYK